MEQHWSSRDGFWGERGRKCRHNGNTDVSEGDYLEINKKIHIYMIFYFIYLCCAKIYIYICIHDDDITVNETKKVRFKYNLNWWWAEAGVGVHKEADETHEMQVCWVNEKAKTMVSICRSIRDAPNLLTTGDAVTFLERLQPVVTSMLVLFPL